MAGLKKIGIDVPAENVVTELTPWIPWSERKACDVDGSPLGDYSGVYVLAHLEARRPKGPADPLDRRIIYVGESSLFERRWNTFQRAIAGRGSHSGGRNYGRTYKCSVPMPTLHVAAFPIWFKRTEWDPEPTDPKSLTCRLRHHVEQALLWHHFYRKSGATLLNRK